MADPDQFAIGATTQPNVVFPVAGDPNAVTQPDAGAGILAGAQPPASISPTPAATGGRMAMPGAGLPNIIQLLAGVLKPQQGQVTPGQAPQRPNSRLDVFENFLGNFLSSFAAGMSQSGQRGAEGKGFAAAVQQPVQRQIQQQQIGIQQRLAESQEGLRAAQEQFNRQRSTQFDLVPMTVNGPDGKPEQIMVPQNAIGRIQASIQAAGARTTSATTAAQAKIAAMNPIQKMIDDAYSDYKAGKLDAAGLQKKIQDTAGAASAATRQQKTPNEIELIQRANAGDKDAAATLATLQQNRMDLAKSRGQSMGLNRIVNVYDPELQRETPMFGFDVLAARNSGKALLPAGPMGSNQILMMQRLQTESAPAIKGVRDNIGAYDNAGDRAIFARVMQENPMGGSDPHTWMGNILNQSLQGNLSDKGQKLVVRLQRLNDTIGTLRATLGMPSTNTATALTLRMLPGAATPSSKFAEDQLKQLEGMVTQAVNVPAFGGGPKATGSKLDLLVDKYSGKKP